MDADRRRTLRAAAHPLVLGAATLILVNDLVLRVVSPGWLTGKLSDAGFLVVAPVFAAALLAAAGLSGRVARAAGLVGTAVVYVTLQLWPPLGALFRATHVADAEDLLVLPALAGAVLAWRRARAGRVASALALPFLAGALVATSWNSPQPASWPCGVDQMTWPTDTPLRIALAWGFPANTDAFARGVHLVETATGEEVRLVFAQDGLAVYACARDGLRGDTDYDWQIGPWDVQSNEYAPTWGDYPAVRFRTEPGDGTPVATPDACWLRVASDFPPRDACFTGEYSPPDTGDTWDTGGAR